MTSEMFDVAVSYLIGPVQKIYVNNVHLLNVLLRSLGLTI